MKSVFRSAFDPVPRPLSPGAQLLVVGVLIVGITISVVEYLDSSRPGPLAADPLHNPSSLEAGKLAQPPAEPAARPRSLVRAAPRPSPAAAGALDRPAQATSSQPTSAAVEPMSLRPGEDG